MFDVFDELVLVEMVLFVVVFDCEYDVFLFYVEEIFWMFVDVE